MSGKNVKLNNLKKFFRNFLKYSTTMFFSLFFIFISFIFFLFAGKMNDGVYKKFLENIAFTLLVTSTIGTFLNVFNNNDLIRKSQKSMLLEMDKKTKFQKIGLEEVYLDSISYDFKEFILNSKNLTIVANDAKAWKSSNNTALKYRLKTKNFSTTFILLTLDDDLNNIMLRKTKHEDDKNYIKNKIKTVEKSLKDMHSEPTHKLKILKHNLFNTYSIFMNDEKVLVTPYRVSQGKETVPLYIYKKPELSNCDYYEGCDECILLRPNKMNEFCRIKKDVENLEKYIEKINENENKNKKVDSCV